MKNLTKLKNINFILIVAIVISVTAVAEIASGASGREIIRTNKELLRKQNPLTAGARALGNRTLIKTDQERLREVGQANFSGIEIELEPGLYEIGNPEDDWKHRNYMLIDHYTNDPSNKSFIAMIFPKSLSRRGENGIGKIYLAEPIEAGTAMQYSPVYIDSKGQLKIDNRDNTKAKVLIMSNIGLYEDRGFSWFSREQRYEYVFEGVNNALAGQLWTMQKSRRRIPQLYPWPSSGVFNQKHGDRLLVRNDRLSIMSESNRLSSSFNVRPMNGAEGKFAYLARSKRNVMSYQSSEAARISKLTAFILNCPWFDREAIVVASPTAERGSFRMEFYASEGHSVSNSIRRSKRGPNRFGNTGNDDGCSVGEEWDDSLQECIDSNQD